jgi:hypothetical protein
MKTTTDILRLLKKNVMLIVDKHATPKQRDDVLLQFAQLEQYLFEDERELELLRKITEGDEDC